MENNEVVYLYLDDIIPNRFQPREVFDDQALKELAISIKEHGVIQPIIVRKVENKYEIIAGERRYKASTMAGLTKIPAIIKNLDDKESSKVALIENLQRRDLTPIEEARTYQKILELEDGMTQEQLAHTMGKTQSVVSNKLRLLALPDEVQDALLKEKISERHARSLLNILNKNDQIKMLDKIIAEKMTVRELDKEIKEMNEGGSTNSGGASMNSGISSFGNMMNNNISQNNVTPSNNNFSNNSSIGTLSFNNSANTNVQPQSNTPLFNPTSVDINQIRQNATDINGPSTPNVGVKELMRDTNEQKEENKFKFVPSFDEFFNKNKNNMNNTSAVNSNSSLLNNNDNKSQTNNTGILSPVGNLFNREPGNDINNVNNNSNNTLSFGNTRLSSNSNENNASMANNSGMFGLNNNTNNMNSNTPSTSNNSMFENNFGGLNNNLASSMSGSPLNLNGINNKKDVAPAINDIKNVIKDLEGKGYKVLIDENDSDNLYQITIKVDKTV
mgnify:FL=1